MWKVTTSLMMRPTPLLRCMKGIKVNNSAAAAAASASASASAPKPSTSTSPSPSSAPASATSGCSAGGGSFSSQSNPAYSAPSPLSSGSGGNASVLTGLPHPRRLVSQDQEDSIPYGSKAWRGTMLRLYRRIFTAHGLFLNLDQRMLGDRFVRTEFRRHVEVTPRVAGLFFKGWVDYLRQLEAGYAQRQRTAALNRSNVGGGGGAFASGRAAAHIAGSPNPASSPAGDGVSGTTGRSLTEKELELMSDDQKATVMRLRQEALKIGAERGFRL